MAIDPTLGPAIIREATRLGIDPVALATAIGYETIGKYSPDTRGGAGNRYYGLIQFGPTEQRKYGIAPGMSADEQMIKVGNYLQDRGLKPGAGLLDIYSTINAGSPGHYGAVDASGKSVRQHVAEMQRTYGQEAAALVGQAGEVNAYKPATRDASLGVPISAGYVVPPETAAAFNPPPLSVGSLTSKDLNAAPFDPFEERNRVVQERYANVPWGGLDPVAQSALTSHFGANAPHAYEAMRASLQAPLVAGSGGSDTLFGSSRAQVGGGQPLSPYVRGDFFSPSMPSLQPHATPSAVYQPPTTAQLIQPYTTQYAAPAPSYAAMGAPPSPAMGAAAASGLQGSQLPIAPSDQLSYSQMIQSGVPGDPSQMPVAPPPVAPPPVADVAGSGGTGSLLGNIVQGVKHLVQTAIPGGLHMPQSFANAGMMSGITGFGGGPLPSGVTDRASGASWLGQQAWHPASLFNSSGGINPSGGSSYNYFSPSSPGGIGGYVSHSGQLFTYPTDPDIYHSVAS